MRALVVIALCGCGRLDFGTIAPVAGDGPTPDAPDVGYFVSPTGSNTNPGTRALPWGTLPYALGQLRAGDTLNLVDGDYDARTPVGSLQIDCSAGLANGTATAPIVVRADHPRGAHLFGMSAPVYIQQCAYWQLRDLHVEGLDDTVVTNRAVVSAYSQCDHITFAGLLVSKPNRYGNNSVVEVGHCTNVTVEDTEIYDFHRMGIDTYDSSGTTFRRIYMNGRGYPDIQGGYTSSCPGGDYGMYSYYSRGGVFEDSIVENVCFQGFAAETGRNASTSSDTGVGDNHLFVNDIALATGTYGFWILSDCDSGSPCSSPDRIAANNTIRNSVAATTGTGFLLMGVNNTLDHVTAVGGSQAVALAVYLPADPGLAATGFANDALGAGAGTGVSSTNQASWGVDHSNMATTGTAYSPNDSHVTASTELDPKLGGCIAYLPPTSTMIGIGTSGGNIGADIRTQTQDGVATATPYWNADGSFAGCGAIVAGYNDDPGSACAGVGARLNVGVNGCPAP